VLIVDAAFANMLLIMFASVPMLVIAPSASSASSRAYSVRSCPACSCHSSFSISVILHLGGSWDLSPPPAHDLHAVTAYLQLRAIAFDHQYTANQFLVIGKYSAKSYRPRGFLPEKAPEARFEIAGKKRISQPPFGRFAGSALFRTIFCALSHR
jgi:hypothetical protein